MVVVTIDDHVIDVDFDARHRGYRVGLEHLLRRVGCDANVALWHLGDSTGSSSERPLLNVSPTFHHQQHENSGNRNGAS